MMMRAAASTQSQVDGRERDRLVTTAELAAGTCACLVASYQCIHFGES
jgi:hypothetical protein